jgi:ubiquinone biosynthesis protein UbiJ
MPNKLPTWLIHAALPRLTLLLNHVISSEPAAMSRLRPHTGKSLQLDCAGPPGWPVLPPLVFEITPAGLLEWQGNAPLARPADLRMALDASQPLPFLMDSVRGTRPRLDISGDAALAGDVSWLVDHLRWDIEDDLAPWVGPIVAREAVRLGGWLALGLREAAQRLSSLAARAGVGSAPPPV